jgi:hypothetical protein
MWSCLRCNEILLARDEMILMFYEFLCSSYSVHQYAIKNSAYNNTFTLGTKIDLKTCRILVTILQNIWNIIIIIIIVYITYIVY